ncbi:hypothetical protein [Vibrio sinaloensis]|uniref:hypothetical protein n=1 Tax=Photobacterium sp. (strain ATCC 43367) TaxID=379097 RepID=UPI000689BD67|nr:hypothetical protein [Vibrio sinaloensis]
MFLTFGSTQLMLTQLRESSWINGQIEAPFGKGVNLTYKVSSAWLHSFEIESDFIFLPLETEVYKTGGVETIVKQLIVKDPDGYLVRFLCQQNG